MQTEDKIKKLCQIYPSDTAYIKRLISSAQKLENDNVLETTIEQIEVALKNDDKKTLVFIENMLRRMHIMLEEKPSIKPKKRQHLKWSIPAIILIFLTFYFFKNF